MSQFSKRKKKIKENSLSAHDDQVFDISFKNRPRNIHYFYNILQIFCSTSSIRGMHKISKAETPFLKVLWVGFVITMTMTLVITIVLLVKEYLRYYTAWHTSTKLEDESLFPAITFCSHNPFSFMSNELWSSGRVKSPTEFSSRLSNLSLAFSRHRKYEGFELVIMLDRIENYYTSLRLNETIMLSHQNEFFKFCVLNYQHRKLISRNCTIDLSDNLNVKRFSHRNYFNCWTLEPKLTNDAFDDEIVSLIVVPSLIPSRSIPELKHGFVMDILERGEGLKVILHESGTYPDVDMDGFNIQPGKLNEIAYEPIKWTFLSTPVRICKDDQDSVNDLDQLYRYSFSQCVDAALQKALFKQCRCLSSLWPRYITPNEKYPYCSNFWHGTIDEITERLICITNFMANIKEKKKSFQMKECFPRCNFNKYSSTLSITKWLPSLEKLNRINLMQTQLELLDRNRHDNVSITNFQRFLESSFDVNNTENVNDSLEEDRFTYIQLIRKTKNSTIKKEKLVLDVAILLSRIGGLCSLFIGLTVAFFIEIIEFIYLLFHMRNKPIANENNGVTNVNNISFLLTKNNASSRRNKVMGNDSLAFSNNAEFIVDNDMYITNDFNLNREQDNVVWRLETRQTYPEIDEGGFVPTFISEL